MRRRCHWCENDPLMEAYHDEEWGIPVKNDRDYFERMTLEIFQAGLNWRMILHKRTAFRHAFANFDLAKIAKYGPRDIHRLMNDESIIRNRLKIDATVKNAGKFLAISKLYGSFAGYLASFQTGEEKRLISEMRKNFRFMGPIVAESFLLSVGKIRPPHDKDCWRSNER